MTKILIVDDEKQIRRILTALLADHGFDVAEAVSGEEALEIQKQFCPHIVLLDLSLPGTDGLEILRNLMERKPRPDCIMMTAYGSIKSAVEAMRIGAYDYLAKPFDNDELLMILNRARRLRELDEEIESLRKEMEARYGFSEIVGISKPMREIFHVMAKVAAVDAAVLITGESGTGKELVARAIHRHSARADGPFIAVNCSAIPRDLIEAEFFGHEKGAFTDAGECRQGYFELASGGSLFLDEVGDLSPEAQAKLLRTLQSREIRRIGGRSPIPVDVRLISATNKDLGIAIAKGSIREDLYWRINVVTIKLPPLRERREDLQLLLDHMLDRFQRELRLPVKSIDPAAKQMLMDYDWPGNVRELENTLCRGMILCDGEVLGMDDLPPRIRGGLPAECHSFLETAKLSEAVEEITARIEKKLISARLAQFCGNRIATAESLGICRKTLFNKMRNYSIDGAAEGD